MTDVGRLAGVSAQTVSRYFTGSGYVGAETRARIEAAVAELGYQLNGSARNLRVNSTRTIGVLATGPSVYGTWSILEGLSAAAHEAGYSLLTSQVETAPSDPRSPGVIHAALSQFLSARVDGIVVSSPYVDIDAALERVWESVPVVILSGRSWPSASSATVDSYQAGVLGTRHLVDLGHQRVLHLAGPSNVHEAQERERGYRDVLRAAGLAPLPVRRGDWSAQSGHRIGARVDPDEFTAVLAGNDQMALGLLSALRDRGALAPQDFSVVGVDDMPDARFYAPALTTVHMDFVALGRIGFELVRDRIGTSSPIERRVIAPRLVVRGSTAPAPPR